MAEYETSSKLRVILCRPEEKAESGEIEDKLESMQEVVEGPIQEYMPFHSEHDPRYDDLAVICNEEGKLMRLPPSRAIFDEDGQVMDIIAGPFFICYAPLESESFLSLPEDLEKEFLKKFEKPEKFRRTERGIEVIRFEPKSPERSEAR